MVFLKISAITLSVVSICCNAYWGYKLWKEKCYRGSVDCFECCVLSCLMLGGLLW